MGFDELAAGAGVRRVEAWEYEAAFGPRTAGVLYVFSPGGIGRRWSTWCGEPHVHQLPVLVDAAGELPPREHLRSLVGTGADLVAFSGGKAIRGPQASGLLCGRRDPSDRPRCRCSTWTITPSYGNRRPS